jgi:hypothetical protein
MGVAFSALPRTANVVHERRNQGSQRVARKRTRDAGVTTVRGADTLAPRHTATAIDVFVNILRR